jgi:hypothetical protein
MNADPAKSSNHPFPCLADYARVGLMILGLLLSGCGYTHQGDDPSGGYQWRSLYREDVRSVAVPIFTNKTYRRGVEFRLTKAVVTEIEAKSPYKVEPRERADTILEGEIVDIRLQNLSRDSKLAIPQEQLYVLTVDFTWKDLRNGRILVERKNFQQTMTFYPTLGEGEFVGSQANVEQLALGIVQELQANW